MAFVEIPKQEYPSILQTLQKRLSKSAMACNVLQLILRGCLPIQTITTSVYTYKGVVNDDKEIFVVISILRETYKNYSIIVSSPAVTTDEMAAAFDSLIDWSYPIVFSAVDISFSRVIAEFCGQHGRCVSVDTCDFMAITGQSSALLSIDEVMRDLPAEVQVKPLSPSDAKLVTDRWIFSSEQTEKMMEMRIAKFGSAGVYVEGELISWVVTFEDGSLHALFTEKRHRRKGYGELTMRKACHIAAEMGLIPTVQVHVGNEPSKRLMTKIGFQASHLAEWVDYSPNESAK